MAGADCDWDQLTASLVMSVSADRAEYHIVAENQESLLTDRSLARAFYLRRWLQVTQLTAQHNGWPRYELYILTETC